MHWLILVTFLWAFSFSLIGVYLSGEVDGYIAVFSRMILATVVFIPFLKPRSLQSKNALKLMAIGAIQIGLMYLFLYHSFLYLSVAEVLLFTIFTPIYVTLIDDLVFHRRFTLHWLLAAILSVIGAAIIRYHSVSEHFLIGFLLIQSANLCFAFGQVAYKRLAIGDFQQQRQHFIFFFIGASILTLIAALLFADVNKLPDTATEIGVLLWLGLIASGAGYFLWNYGTKQVNTGQLATMNNALIPAGLLVNLFIWGSDINIMALLAGGAIIVVSVIISSVKRQTLLDKAKDH
ncbi:DMT family transporter [Pleionea mediterranea]|uniref:Carboxylate/amino acid/amine transporter n=1 Tax=Pleionea mediterranea TaxID=523701 RepID=A0A316FZI4_9GAMM|nr:DMT family transporter [Pleionea mediterranea]PWK53802.1 carboxylate/amino acid/amine transporter [Pleionea mediterranea]